MTAYGGPRGGGKNRAAAAAYINELDIPETEKKELIRILYGEEDDNGYTKGNGADHPEGE